MHGLGDDLNLFISSELLETILNTGRPTENSTEAATQLIDTGCPEYIAVSASILKLVILWNTPNT